MSYITLVKPLADETFYSLIARISVLNNLSSEYLSKVLFDETEFPRAADSKVDLERFFEVTFFSYGSMDVFIGQHTNLNYRKFITCPLRTFENFEYWENKVIAKKMPLIQASNFESNVWRWCPLCSKEDIQEHGVTFWRRQHQLPGVYICDRHFKLLDMISIPYRMRQHKYLIPHQIPSAMIRISMDKGANKDIAIRLGEVSRNILYFDNQNINQAAVRETIKTALQEMNFLTKNNFVTNDCLNSLDNYYQKIMNIKELKDILKKKNLRTSINNIITSNDVMDSNPSLFPILISWCFENWIDFKNKYEWQCLMNLPCSRGNIDKDMTSISFYRSICEEFISKKEKPTRKLFWEKNYKICRWLTKYDNVWLNQHLPSQTQQSFKQILMDF